MMPKISLGYKVGWRYWYVSDSLNLKSLAVMGASSSYKCVEWPKGEVLKSKCFRRCGREADNRIGLCGVCKDENCPHPGADCGIYSFLNRDMAISQAGLYPASLFGTVRLAGRAFVTEDSVCRAEEAYPETISGGVCAACRKLVKLNDFFIVKAPAFGDLRDLYDSFLKTAALWGWKNMSFSEPKNTKFFVCTEHADLYTEKGYITLSANLLLRELALEYGIELLEDNLG